MRSALHGGARPPNPVCAYLNVAVHAIARRLFPTGFDVGGEDEAPFTLEALTAHIERTGRMMVWDGASGTTIFDCPETNYAYRAWHDWVHWKHQLPFTMQGERLAVKVQQGHLRMLYSGHPEIERMCALVEADIIGILEYHEQKGEYPEDQRAVALEYYNRQLCHGSRALAA